ncbi:MAG: prepilin-type N-terminal cleavage/methylation domain-containing protein [Hyphomicrobium sp.]|uniref:type II secretion system protein n=1 Tax=Hyphomicrobium sp. TaxID=82 RepID=UPI00356682D3
MKLSAVKNSPLQFWFLRFSSKTTHSSQKGHAPTPVLVWFRKAKQILRSLITLQKQNHVFNIKHGRNFVKPKLVSGFTLIELLVVISIIALLASVIMAGMQDARSKAGNSAIIQQIDAYTKAAELYRLDYGKYPSNSPSNTTAYCLGDYKNIGGAPDNAACGYGLTNESATLQSAFLEKISQFKAVSSQPVIVGVAFLGATYECTTSACDGFKIKWALQGDIPCGLGASKTLISPNTWCVLTK